MNWEIPDIEALLAARQYEATDSGNAGSYQVPLGKPLRRQSPAGPYGTPECDGSGFCDYEPGFPYRR